MTVPLTADLCAHAIVAAARVLGEDPIIALTGRRLRGRQSRSRCLRPAALALYEATDCHQGRLCQALGADKYGLNAVRDTYRQAYDAACCAIAAAVEKKPRPAATVVAPPPVAQETPPRVDHTAAIAEAVARRRARTGGIDVVVVGVEADVFVAARSEGSAFSTRRAADTLIGATEPGGCVWPMGDPRAADYRSCQATPLAGRLYCAEHLTKAGMKPVAKVIQTVGRVAAGYGDREAG